MITDKNLSILIPSQLPEYIQNDPTYSKFIVFLQAYYEWMEQENNVLYQTNNLLNYSDIDTTTNDFLNYYVNDFLQYFPVDALISKPLALRAAKELYLSKGTPASYQFLFRVLFDSDCDLFFTRDAVFKTSDGLWYVPKSLNLSTYDTRFLNIKNYRILGESSKSIAIIENSILAGTKTQVFISNIERSFQSGEFVRVVDINNQDVIVNGSNLRAKLVGQISQININPTYRGSLYNPNDPVVVYGGLSQAIQNPVGASAVVGSTTSGSIQKINVNNGGFGYTTYPNTFLSISNAPTATATIGSVTAVLPPTIVINNGGVGYNINDIVIKGNTSNYITFADVTAVNANGTITAITYRSGVNVASIYGISANIISSNSSATNASISIASVAGNGQANATYIVADTISLKIQEVHSGHANGYLLGNTTNPVSYHFNKFPTANINTKLSDAFTFDAFSTYSISSVIVGNGGGGITQLPIVSAKSTYITDVYNPADAANTLGQNIQGNLSSLGILAPIQILSPGTGYRVNDKIVFSGGSGYGASANVISVDASGKIQSIAYIYPTNAIQYPLGGMGYRSEGLPTLTINSANTLAGNASIIVPGILGSGASFSLSLDRVGAINTINLTSSGEDYIIQPNVSLQIQDIVVTNPSLLTIPSSGDVVYQGTSYSASVDSVSQIQFNVDPTKILYNLRVYNYNSTPVSTSPINAIGKNTQLNISTINYPANTFFSGSPTYILGIKQYGDGTARATAKFLDGLSIGQGQYLNTQGQPSAFSVLQNENYNNYTYQITVEEEISKYRDILLNLLHPSGMKMLGRYAIKSNSSFDIVTETALYQGKQLSSYTGSVASGISIVGNFTNKSNNIINVNNVGSANISTFIFPNNIIKITPTNGQNVVASVLSVNSQSNTVIISSNVWLTIANAAYGSGNVNTKTVQINSITSAYDVINNGIYSTTNHLQDIIYIGNSIKIASNTYIVSGINYQTNVLTLSSNLLSNVTNTLISVNRTISAGATSNSNQVIIYGSIGTIYIQELTTESGLSLTTEDGQTLILG